MSAKTFLSAGPVPEGYAPIADVRDPADGRYVPVRSPRGQEILGAQFALAPVTGWDVDAEIEVF